MELDSSQYALKGSKERERRKKEGKCFKCGKKGHILRTCDVPLPQARRSSYAQSNLSRPSTPPTKQTNSNQTRSRSSDNSSPRGRHSRRSSSRSLKGSSQR